MLETVAKDVIGGGVGYGVGQFAESYIVHTIRKHRKSLIKVNSPRGVNSPEDKNKLISVRKKASRIIGSVALLFGLSGLSLANGLNGTRSEVNVATDYSYYTSSDQGLISRAVSRIMFANPNIFYSQYLANSGTSVNLNNRNIPQKYISFGGFSLGKAIQDSTSFPKLSENNSNTSSNASKSGALVIIADQNDSKRGLGVSEKTLEQELQSAGNIPAYVVNINGNNNPLFKSLATNTGGAYYDVNSSNFNSQINSLNDRLRLNSNGPDQNNGGNYYFILSGALAALAIEVGINKINTPAYLIMEDKGEV